MAESTQEKKEVSQETKDKLSAVASTRARNDKGRFKADNPKTPDINEAFKEGQGPNTPEEEASKLQSVLALVKHLEKKITSYGNAPEEGLLTKTEEKRFALGLEVFKGLEQTLDEWKVEHEQINW